MGGGIVGTFQIVGVPRIPFGDNSLHECFQIGTGGGVPVFAQYERGTCMLEKKKAHTLLDSPLAQLSADRFGNIVKSLTVS